SRRLRDLHSFPTRRSSDLTPMDIVPLNLPSGGRGWCFITWTDDEWAALEIVRQSLIDVVPDGLNLGICEDVDRILDGGPTLSDRSEEHTSELQSRFDLVCR